MLDRALRAARRVLGRAEQSVSTHYEVLTREQALAVPCSAGWDRPEVARAQHDAFLGLVQAMRAGAPRVDLRTVASAVRRAGLDGPSLLEVGAGSGYLQEVLAHLAPGVRYTGLDASHAMLARGREAYPGLPLVQGDALQLPFADGAFDIVLNGGSLMHTVDYAGALAECARVAGCWCILHTVPVLLRRPTTYLRKRAYGAGDVVEVIVNAAELEARIAACGLRVVEVLPSVPYDLSAVLGERSASRTYVCARGAPCAR